MIAALDGRAQRLEIRQDCVKTIWIYNKEKSQVTNRGQKESKYSLDWIQTESTICYYQGRIPIPLL